MDRVISSITAKKSDVIGNRQVKVVVRGVVTGTRGYRLLTAARTLLTQLRWRMSEWGRMAFHSHRPLALAAARSLAPACAGGSGQPQQMRLRRLGSRRHVGRF